MSIWAYARYAEFTIRLRAEPPTRDEHAPHTRSRWTRPSRPPFTGLPASITHHDLELVDDVPEDIDIVLRNIPTGEWAVFDHASNRFEWIAGVPADDLDGFIMDGTPYERPILDRDE